MRVSPSTSIITPIARFVAACAATGAACFLVSLPAEASSFPGYAHGEAQAVYGTVAASGNTNVSVGPIAPATFDCKVVSGSVTNTVASISLPGAVSSGTAYDNVSSTHGSTSVSMQSTSTIQNVNLLGGMITATGIDAVANSLANTAGASSNGTGSSFVSLQIGGTSYSGTPAPNTTIPLPGIGSVVLNEQVVTNTSASTDIHVTMIHIMVTESNPLVAIGADIKIARADSAIEVLPQSMKDSASSVGLLVNGYAGNLNLVSGPWAPAFEECGTGSNTDHIASISTPVGGAGASVDTAATTLTSTFSGAQATSDIGIVSLLGGLLKANAIESTSTIQVAGTVSRTGSTTLVKATLLGLPIASNPAPNTKLVIPGVGYAILNEQTSSTTATTLVETVTALDIHVTLANTFNLPAGARIQVAQTTATVQTF